MEIYLVIIAMLAIFILASFILGVITDNKIFILLSFLFLMFGGVLIQSSEGIIIGTRPIPSNDGWVYENVTVSLTDPVLYLVSQGSFWLGLVLSAWIGLVAAFGQPARRGSPFNY